MTPHHHTSTTIGGFFLDAILGLLPMAISLADINAILQIAGASVAVLVSIVRLYFLIRKGGKE